MVPKVSICIITYNQKHFIAQAIESALMQKVNFPYEIIIGDDFSNDGTRDILIEYQKKYPEIIRLILHPLKNPGLPAKINFIKTLYLAKGKYIALLEGDDYWTHPDKLQKQIDFLDIHPDYSSCFHWAMLLRAQNIEPKKYGPLKIKQYYTVEDLLRDNNFIATCSVVYRNGLFGQFPDWYYEVPVGDFPLNILNARCGKIGFINQPMAVYRLHEGGLYEGKTRIDKLLTSIGCYLLIGKNLKYANNTSFKMAMSDLYYELAIEYIKMNNKGEAKKMMLIGYRYYHFSALFMIKTFTMLYASPIYKSYIATKKLISNIIYRFGVVSDKS